MATLPSNPADFTTPAPAAAETGAGVAGGFHHITVLRNEVVDAVATCPAAQAVPSWVVDATLGGGGHTEALLERLPHLSVLGLDRDPQALAAATARLARFGSRFAAVHTPFSGLAEVLREAPWPDRLGTPPLLSAVVADLGVSSPQLDQAARGFSFRLDGPLDMRMDTSRGPTVADLLRDVRVEDLADVLYQYGDIERSIGTAKQVLAAFAGGANTSATLAEALAKRLPRSRSMHPATMVFQALRIWVNRELDELDHLLRDAPGLLAPGGVLAVISFHSGEDRLVKQAMATLCDGETDYFRPHRKAQAPGSAEVAANPRARSAKLRVLRRRHPDDPRNRYVADGGKHREQDDDGQDQP
jgi:16S rRNA (cytosine1402-N4)-methyltransferase